MKRPMPDHCGPTDLTWMAFRYVVGEMSADESATFEQRLAVEQEAREAVARTVRLTQAVRMADSGQLPRVAPLSAAESRHGRKDGGKVRASWVVVAASAVCLAFALGLHLSGGPQPRQPAGIPLAADQTEAQEPKTPESEIEGIERATPDEEAARQLVADWRRANWEWPVQATDQQATDENVSDEHFSEASTDRRLPTVWLEKGDGPEGEDFDFLALLTSFPDIGDEGSGEDEAEDEFVVPEWMLAAVFAELDFTELDESDPAADRTLEEN